MPRQPWGTIITAHRSPQSGVEEIQPLNVDPVPRGSDDVIGSQALRRRFTLRQPKNRLAIRDVHGFDCGPGHDGNVHLYRLPYEPGGCRTEIATDDVHAEIPRHSMEQQRRL